MKGSKICISLCADTVDGLFAQIGKTSGLGCIFEIRFDCLSPAELAVDDPENNAARRILSSFPDQRFIFTLRSAGEGGKRAVADSERRSFWKPGICPEFADIELDLAGIEFDKETTKIVSHHDFEKPSDLRAVIERLSETDAGIYKIAVAVDDASDAVDVWNAAIELRQRNPGKKSIAVAMGEAGKWTRILGPAFGAPWTYASDGPGSEVAPGQISFKDLTDVFRLEHLNNETGIYGIVSGSSRTSLSPYMHNAAFAGLGENAVYLPFEVKNIGEFVKRMIRPSTREVSWNLRGLSVTNPHKESIIRHLDFLDITAESIGAVNTVSIVDGHLVGFNTDAEGFIAPLRKAFPNLENKTVAVFGSGGAARASLFALKSVKAVPFVFARNTKKAESIALELDCQIGDYENREKAMKSFDIAVNATTLGSKGELENMTPISSTAIKNLQMVYDLVYNPYQTLFLREADSANVPSISGYEMLVEQGIRQFEIWTGLKAPVKVMSQAILSRLS